MKKPKKPKPYSVVFKDWKLPNVLHVGQKVKVYRWQEITNNGGSGPNSGAYLLPDGTEGPGHIELGTIKRIMVVAADLPFNDCHSNVVDVAAIDMTNLAKRDMTKQRNRPNIGIEMRGNVYWFKAYRIDAIGPNECGWPPPEPPPPPITTKSLFEL